VERIRWEEAAGETTVLIEADGALGRTVYSASTLRDANPRVVLDLRGIERPYPQRSLEVGTPQLDRIRTGLHGPPGSTELRIVLDLPSARVELARVEETAGGLRLVLAGP
jgi:hypothetical protein